MPFGFFRFFAIALLLGIAYAVRKGQLWVRWILLALIVVGVFASVVTLLASATSNPKTVEWYMELLQDAIQFTATIVLFIPYHVPEVNELEQEEV